MYSHIYLKDTLNSALPTINALATNQSLPALSAFIDARSLSCPLPLLKCKIALRELQDGDALYLVASDANACQDLVAFCKKNGHTVKQWQNSHDDTGNTAQTATFHFIISKHT